MGTKVEFIYGDRCSGKTTEIINSLNDKESIGIVMRHSSYKDVVNKRSGKHLNNVSFLLKPSDCYGKHFDKVFIDDGGLLDWKQWLINLRDSMIPSGGKISLYFNTPTTNFSVRIKDKKGNK